MSKLVNFTLGLLLTVAALFLVTGWDLQETGNMAGVVFLLDVGIEVWATRVRLVALLKPLSGHEILTHRRIASVYNPALILTGGQRTDSATARLEGRPGRGLRDDKRRDREPSGISALFADRTRSRMGSRDGDTSQRRQLRSCRE